MSWQMILAGIALLLIVGVIALGDYVDRCRKPPSKDSDWFGGGAL